MRSAALGLLCAALLAGCAPVGPARGPCELAELRDGGIGGTGILARDGGIGGTGIVGTVTGFGSVCVAGIEVQYDSGTPVTFDGQPVSPKQLAIGQTVAIEVRYGVGGWNADVIRILRAPAWVFGPNVKRVWLEGRVERVAPGEVVVLGRAVRLPVADPGLVAGARVYIHVEVAADGTLSAQRVVLPRASGERPRAPEHRLHDAPREPRFEPRIPAPPPAPGRTGR
jgi:hypothetical protein